MRKILRPFQYGCFFKSGGEACVRSFQYENDLFPESLAKVDGRNFFNEIVRESLVDGASLISDEFAEYCAQELSEPTTYFYYSAEGVTKITTMFGTIQGRVLSSILTCLAMIPAQKNFVNTVKFKYPQLNVIGADSNPDPSEIKPELLHELPEFDVFASECPPSEVSGKSPLQRRRRPSGVHRRSDFAVPEDIGQALRAYLVSSHGSSWNCV